MKYIILIVMFVATTFAATAQHVVDTTNWNSLWKTVSVLLLLVVTARENLPCSELLPARILPLPGKWCLVPEFRSATALRIMPRPLRVRKQF